MTAHRIKPTITPERVDWFARYYSQNMAWGVFHVCLDDGNYWCGAADKTLRPGTERVGNIIEGILGARYDFGRDEWPPDLRDAASWFDSLTASQRRRLGRKAERRARELGIVPGIVPGPYRMATGTWTVTEIDVENGTITLEASDGN